MSSDNSEYLLHIDAKLKRAAEHMKTVDEIIDEGRTDPVRTRRHYDEEKQMLRILIDETRIPPPILSVIAGEAIHQIRSSLDYLAYALVAMRNSDFRKHEPAFPIASTPTSFEQLMKRVDGVSDNAKAIMELVQPFNGGLPTSRHPLWRLKIMNDIDKHRLLNVISAVAAVHKFTGKNRKDILGIDGPMASYIENDRPLLNIETSNSNMEFQLDTQIAVIFSDIEMSGIEAVGSILFDMHTSAVMIINSLVCEFK